MAQLGQSKSAMPNSCKQREVWVFIPGWNAEAIADAAQSAEVSADGQSARCP